jgi:hypothetical protein
MPETPTAPTAAHPRWDGRRVLFEMVDQETSVACAISPSALQELSAVRRFKPADLLRCFAAARERIETIALAKMRARRSGVQGVLSIWVDDVDDAPSATPAAAALRVQAAGTG